MRMTGVTESMKNAGSMVGLLEVAEEYIVARMGFTDHEMQMHWQLIDS